jgi:hypothetical protein
MGGCNGRDAGKKGGVEPVDTSTFAAAEQAPVTPTQPSSATSTGTAEAAEPYVPSGGRYTKATGGGGELSVTSKPGGISRLYVIAGGIPDGMATAADCALIAEGVISDNGDFEGVIIFAGGGDLDEANPDESYAVESGSKLTAVFKGSTAEITSFAGGLCGIGSGLAGVYRR